MAHTAIEATRSPIITSLTTKSALRNRSEIESDGADGIATPCPATWPRAAEEAKFPTKNRAGPHRSRYRFPAKGVQTRARVPPAASRACKSAGYALLGRPRDAEAWS